MRGTVAAGKRWNANQFMPKLVGDSDMHRPVAKLRRMNRGNAVPTESVQCLYMCVGLRKEEVPRQKQKGTPRILARPCSSAHL